MRNQLGAGLAVAASILIVGTMFWLSLPSLVRTPPTTNLLAVEMIGRACAIAAGWNLTMWSRTDQQQYGRGSRQARFHPPV